MKNRAGNKVLSLVLAVLLVFTMLPIPIMAESDVMDKPEAAETGNNVITAFDALAVETATQAVPTGTAPEALNLPGILAATIDGEPGTADNVTWQSHPKYDADTESTYTFKAVLPDCYNIADGVIAPVISVTVTADKETETDPVNIAPTPDITEDTADQTDIAETPIPHDQPPTANEEVQAAADTCNEVYQAARAAAAPRAALVPGSLDAGNYTIEQNGADVVLMSESGTDSCVLNPATQIVVPSGDLTLTVNADVTIQRLLVYNGNLIIHGEKTFTAENSSGYGIFSEGSIEVNGKLTGNGSGSYHGVYSNGSITVSGNGTLVGINGADSEAVFAGDDLIVHGKLTGAGHISTLGNITVSSTGTLNGSSYVLAAGGAGGTGGNLEIAGTLKSGSFVQSGRDMTISGMLESGGGVWAGGNINIDGTVNNTGSNVSAGGNITVTGALVSNESLDSGIMLDGNFYINGGTVTVNENTFNGIYVPAGDIIITGGSLTANGNGYPGVWAEGDLNISTGGILTANENNSSGIALQGCLSINGGSLTANNNIYNGAYLPNGDISVKDGGTLTANGNGAGNDGPGIWVATGIEVIGGRLTANDNLGNGAYVPYGYIYIEESGILAAENNTYPSVCVGSGPWAGGITVTSGELTGICDDDYGVLVRGFIRVDDDGKLTGISEHNRGVWAAGDIIVSGELTGSGGGYGVRADGDIIVNENGILTGESTYTGVSSWYGSIDVAGTLISKGDGILANGGSVDAECDINVSGELISDGKVAAYNNIDIKAGATLSGSYGVAAFNDLTVAGTLYNTGDWVYAGNNATVTGVLTSNGSYCEGIVAKEDFYIDGGTVTANENTDNGVWVTFGNIYINNGGTLTAQNNGEAGVWLRDGSIMVTDGKLTGTGDIYGVYAYNSITADGTAAVIKGVAKTRGDSGSSTASVYSVNGKISAVNGGTIEEEYTDTPVDFDDTTPQNPYADGFNITDIANYTWTPDLEVSGPGLLAMRNYTDAQIVTGIRKGNIADEIVLLDADSIHKITITGTLSTTEYMVTYKANGGEGDDIDLTYHAGDTVTVASNSFIREGYSFTEWSTGESDGISYYEGATFIMPSNHMILHARWELNEYTVTFDTNGGTAVDSQAVSHGDTADEPENPTKTGWIFSGWYTDNGTFAEEWNFDDPITKDLSLYAKWIASDIPYEFTTDFGTFTGSGNVTGTVNAPHEKFVRLTVNGTELNSKSYTVASGSTIITLNETYLKTLSNGAYAVTAEFTDGTAATTLTVDVSKPDIVSVTGVTLDKSTAVIKTGRTLLLTATVSPSDAANKNVTWSSSDTAIATVDANGLVTAIKAGKANITVTTEDGGYTAVCKVTVTAASRGTAAISRKTASPSGKTRSAKTDDSSNFWLWFVLIIVSLSILVFNGYRKNRPLRRK